MYSISEYTPFPTNLITPASASATGLALFGYNGGGLPASTAWPSANMAIYIPFTVDVATTVYQVGWHNGAATVSGTRDVGVYNAGGTKLIAGSATGSGASVMQFVDVTDTILPPGQYWMAANCSNTTNWHAWVPAAPITAAMGILTQAAAGTPLPGTATMALNQTLAFIPLIGLQCRSTA